MDLRLEGRRHLLWEMVSLCGPKRDTIPPRHHLWSRVSPGRVGEAGSNQVKVSPDEPCSALGVDKQCQFLALAMPGDSTTILGRELGCRKHVTRVYTCGVRQILVGLIREDFLEEEPLPEQLVC